MSKIICTWGSDETGKTIFATKLANELSKKGSVILVYTDTITPLMENIFDLEESESLGRLLEKEIITQEEILKYSNTLKKNDNLCVLGYKQGENFRTYATYTKERANELVINLSHIVDYLIIDVPSNFHTNELAKAGMKLADYKMRFCGGTFKDINYFKSAIPILSSPSYNLDKDIVVLSKIDDTTPKNLISSYYGKIDYTLYSIPELHQQFIEGKLFNKLTSKEGKVYNSVIQKIVNTVNEIEVEELNLLQKFKNKIQSILGNGATNEK